MPAETSAVIRPARSMKGSEAIEKNASEHPTRMPTNRTSASSARYPADTSLPRSFPISPTGLGAARPMRMNASVSVLLNRDSSGAFVCTPTISSRRSPSLAEPGDRALAAAATSSDPKPNAQLASSIGVHLVLNAMADPEETDRLNHNRADDHPVPHRLGEQQVHLCRRDEGERAGKTRRQRQQHKAGEPPVGRVGSHLTQDLEP